MESEFKDLLLEFGTIMDVLGDTDDLPTRRAMLSEANAALSRARTVWQNEMKALRSGLESLREAHARTARLDAGRHDASTMFQFSAG